MKVIIHRDLNFGGVEKQLLFLINYLRHDDYLLLLCKKQGELLSDVKLKNIAEIGSYPRGNFDLIWFLKLFNILRKIRPRPTLVLSFHPSIHFYSVLLKFLNLSVYLSLPGILWKGRLFILRKYLFRKSDLLIPVSGFIASQLKTEWKLKNVFTINNTAIILNKANEDFIVQKYQKEITTLKLVSCSRIDTNKDVQGIIYQIEKLIKNGIQIELTIVGNGPKLVDCKKDVQRLKINKFVKFLNFIEDPTGIIKDADYLILNSSYEGLPTVILEAWAVGTIVISNDYFGLDDSFIRDMYNGFIYEKSTDGLSKKILQIDVLQNSEKIHIALNAYKEFDNVYSHKTYIKKYFSILEK